MEALRWREMRNFTRESSVNLLDRVRARIDAWLGRI
jgi:hypothetical protein